jgi:hypothetical protein
MHVRVFAMSVALSAVEAFTQDMDMSIGERTWPPVSNGVAFIDGKYIPPPYVISRREGEIYLNGFFWDWTIKWPPQKKTPLPPPPETMPNIPATITAKTTRYDKDYLSYVNQAYQYLIAKHGTKKGVEMMVDIYKKLPCIKEAHLNENSQDTIDVVWMDGSKGGIRQAPMPRADLNLTREQAEKYIDSIAEIYVRGLGENRYYYVMGKGDRRQGLFGGFQGTFGLYARALRASKDEADFLAIMKTNQPPGGISETWLKLFYSHKDDLPKWESRLLESDKK